MKRKRQNSRRKYKEKVNLYNSNNGTSYSQSKK